jgi:hypothetical protein
VRKNKQKQFYLFKNTGDCFISHMPNATATNESLHSRLHRMENTQLVLAGAVLVLAAIS